MTKQLDQQLAAEAQAGNKHSQLELLQKYERLCHKLARKFGFTAKNHDHEDLVQEGHIGLLKAIETYDPSHGASFMTWAYYHVRGSIAGAGKSDRKQPDYPLSIEDNPRAYNVEDPTQEISIRDDLPRNIVKRIIEECCGGLHTKRAQIVMDRYGLLGRRELRNCECAKKYGLTKYAVTSHTCSFKKKARDRFPELECFV
jgi:RNA polymerase sigma factor (sigma-70 family)